MSENRFDLHTHSIVSDGTVTPSEIVRVAAHKTITALAIIPKKGIEKKLPNTEPV